MAHFEKESASPALSPEHLLQLRNAAQILLAESSQTELGDWIEKNAERFSKVWDAEIALRFNEDPGPALKELKEKLYH